MRLWVKATALLLAFTAGNAIAAPAAERQAQLMNLLKQDCGSCHGLTLKGGLGPALLPQNLKGKSDDMLIGTILHGRPGTPMPPWKPELNREDAKWLVGQMRKGVQQ